MSAKQFLLFAALIAITSAQSEDPTKLLENISLPPELQGKVDPKDLDTVQKKAVDEFKTRCEKNGGPEAYLKAKNGTQDLTQCMSRLVNVTALQDEIEKAKPHGNVDEVFKKYCNKKPEFESCMDLFTNSSAACFSDKEQVHLKTIHNISLQLADFICFKEGDRIALFIAEGGQECFQEKQEQLRDCANKTLGLKGELDVSSVSDVAITFDDKQCSQMSALQQCVVSVLETCVKPTSANIVESLFKFIRKSTPCKDHVKDEGTKARSQKAETQKGGATALYVTSATLVTALLTTLIV